MKLLLLITITFTINVSLMNKGNSKTSDTQTSEISITSENNIFSIYDNGLKYINKTKDDFLGSITDYSKYLIAMILGEEKNNTTHLSSNDSHVTDDSDDNLTIKHPCSQRRA